MISYSQNREDVVLARGFAGRRKGFYIDVGAEDPTAFSVTKHFYDLGWRGINVEPTPSAFEALERERPDDVNLRVGLGDHVGTATLFEGPPDNHGSSTFDAQLAAELEAHGHVVRPIADVPITTLAHVCKEWVGDREIDFLKIDVEGWEHAVIEGADWNHWRPLVVVVEATVPNTATPSHAEWESILLDAGYVCTLFDGLNRFYCRADRPELHAALSVPANVLDDAVDFRVVEDGRASREQLAQQADALDRERREHQALVDRFELDKSEHRRQVASLETALDRAEEAAQSYGDALRTARRELHLALDRLAQQEDEIALQDVEAMELRRRAASAEVQLEQVTRDRDNKAREVAALHASKTFRWSRMLRTVYGRLRGRG